MGCGCKGSTRNAQAGSVKTARTANVRTPRKGGPGEKGYYWTGPPKTSEPRAKKA